MIEEPSAPPQGPPRWQPVSAIERRVLGVLVEKAKTTPDAYPLSLNAITTGCNQKSNRHPAMQLEPEDVEAALERLREAGAVGIVQGYGRVSKYRHYLYEWLGVDKVELAVMAELLLRGAQTEGELRAHAARMEPIADLSALRPVVAALKSKGLVLALTPEGRGHVVAHTLYLPAELEKVKAQYAMGPIGPADLGHEGAGAPTTPADRLRDTSSEGFATPAGYPGRAGVQPLESQLDELRLQVAQFRSDLDALAAGLRQVQEEFQRLRTELGA